MQNAPILYSFSTPPDWHRHRRDDDGRMRGSREPMTIARLKQSMDGRFRSVDRRFQAMDRRFAGLERKKADKSDVRRLERKVDRGFREIRQEIKDTAAETRRHFDAVVESLHDDFRLFADAIARHTERLDHHDVRIGRQSRT
jgi:L-alanine-DL-glutamate epimerase-like enolase superfamily enzyme